MTESRKSVSVNRWAVIVFLIIAALFVSCSGDYDNNTMGKDTFGPGDLLDVTVDDDADDDYDDDTGDDDTDDDDTGELKLEGFNVLYFDVGLGDSMLISIPEGPEMRYVLIDGGSIGEGQYAICPVFDLLGIEALDIMIVTHPHFDHCGGLAEVFDCVNVLEVWENGDALPGEDAWDAYVPARNNWGGDVFNPAFGFVEYIGQAALRVLITLGDFSTVNDNSMFIAVSYAGKNFVFGADAEVEAQTYLASSWPDVVTSDILKIPCHAGPSAQDFVDAAAAPIGIVSVGENGLGYPYQTTLDAYEATGMDVYITEDTGNILAAINEDGEIELTMPFPPEENEQKQAGSFIPYY